jgi:hypothetical protein
MPRYIAVLLEGSGPRTLYINRTLAPTKTRNPGTYNTPISLPVQNVQGPEVAMNDLTDNRLAISIATKRPYPLYNSCRSNGDLVASLLEITAR